MNPRWHMLGGLVVVVSWLSMPHTADRASIAGSPIPKQTTPAPAGTPATGLLVSGQPPQAPVSGAARGPALTGRAVQPMTIDPDRVAVHLVADHPPMLDTWLEGLPANIGADTDWHGRRWMMLSRFEPHRDKELLWDSIGAQLTGLPGVEYATPVFVDALGGPLVPAPSVLVAFEADVTDRAARQVLRDAGISDHALTANFAQLRSVYQIATRNRTGRGVMLLADTLKGDPRVRYAEPDWIFTGRRSDVDPNDPLYDACWGLHNTGQIGNCQSAPGVADVDIDAPEAWDITTGSDDVIIVVIDDGVQLDHPDLNTGEQYGEDFTGDLPAGISPGWPVDACDQHGTAVAGVIAAKLNNLMGGVGAAPGVVVASARAHPSSPACDGSFTVQASWIAAALAWAQNIGARVTNNSASYGFSPNVIVDAYEQSHTAGLVHVASSGNSGDSLVSFPASIEVVNAVGAINPDGSVSSFSNTGSDLAMVAPGTSILTTDRTGAAGYVPGSHVCIGGTSFAAPHVAAVAGLMLCVDGALDATTVDDLLRASATDLGEPGFDNDTGYGLVNARRAVEYAVSVAAADQCDDAPEIESGEHTFGTWLATSSGPVPPLCSNVRGLDRGLGLFNKDVWFLHTAQCAGMLSISVCGQMDFSPAIAVYDDVPCDSLTGAQLACASGSAGCETPITVELVVAQGQRVLIRLGDGGGAPAGVGSLVIECTPMCPGDVNDDDQVDLADLLAVIANWGSDDPAGDANIDGIVDLSDLLVVIANWGNEC